MAITAQPNVNLGGIFLQTKDCLRKIKTSLITSGESFKPPLIQFNSHKIQSIIEGFNVKENEELNQRLSPFSLSFSKKTSLELKKVLNTISLTIPDLDRRMTKKGKIKTYLHGFKGESIRPPGYGAESCKMWVCSSCETNLGYTEYGYLRRL